MSRLLYYFTPEMLKELTETYATTKASDIAKKFNFPVRAIHNKAFDLGLKKDKEFLRQLSRESIARPDHPARKHWIKKGDVSHNKGKKQAEYMSTESIERTKSTRFKKGQSVWNHKEVGYERLNADGYVEVKVAEPNVFKLKQRHIWEQRNGPIPKGHNIQFKDKKPLNLEPDNLYMISRKDQMKHENSMYALYPKEIQLAIQARGALTRKINELTKNTQDE